MTEAPRLEDWFELLGGSGRKAVWLPVLSGSMGPVLLPGDEVLVEPCPWRNCRTGEIIVFRQGGALTAHRLVFKGEIFGKCVLLFQQGDAMHRGGFIRQENILGKCTARRRDGSETALADHDADRRIARWNRRRSGIHCIKGVVKWILGSMPFFRWRRGR